MGEPPPAPQAAQSSPVGARCSGGIGHQGGEGGGEGRVLPEAVPEPAVSGGGDVSEGPVVALVVGTAQVGDDEAPGSEVGAGPRHLQRAMAGAGEHHGVVALAKRPVDTGAKGRFHDSEIALLTLTRMLHGPGRRRFRIAGTALQGCGG